MKFKKVISIFMAVVIMLSVSVMAFAIEEIPMVKHGSIGTNISWEYDQSEKTLTLSGDGKIESLNTSSTPDIISGSLNLPDYKEQAKFAEKIIIGDGITEIGINALSGFFYVNEILLSATVETIDNQAFAQLKSLENLIIPSNIKTIGDGAFENCINLKSVTLQNGVNYVGERAFAGAYTLKNVFIPESVSEIGEDAFTLFVPGARFINESDKAAIVPTADILNSYSFTSYEYAEQYAYYFWLDEDMRIRDVYSEKEILVGIYEKFGVSYMSISDLQNDFYNNIAIDSNFADDSVIECFATSAQHQVCLDSNINHVVADSDFDCLCGYHDIYYNEYIAPSCTENGYIGGIICLECEEVIENPDIIPPAGHTDKDNDNTCDVCGADIQLSVGERIIEFFRGIVNSILAIFRRLFG